MELGTKFKVGDVKLRTINEEKYQKLLARIDWLNALEAAGVDNWNGCEVASEILEEWQNA